MDFFIRDTQNMIPVEVKARVGSTPSLNKLINSNSFPDIKWGIKLSHQNIGFNGKSIHFLTVALSY